MSYDKQYQREDALFQDGKLGPPPLTEKEKKARRKYFAENPEVRARKKWSAACIAELQEIAAADRKKYEALKKIRGWVDEEGMPNWEAMERAWNMGFKEGKKYEKHV